MDDAHARNESCGRVRSTWLYDVRESEEMRGEGEKALWDRRRNESTKKRRLALVRGSDSLQFCLLEKVIVSRFIRRGSVVCVCVQVEACLDSFQYEEAAALVCRGRGTGTRLPASAGGGRGLCSWNWDRQTEPSRSGSHVMTPLTLPPSLLPSLPLSPSLLPSLSAVPEACS